jgi:hypothetical protein
MFEMIGGTVFVMLGISFFPALFRVLLATWPIIVVATLYGYFVLGITGKEGEVTPKA